MLKKDHEDKINAQFQAKPVSANEEIQAEQDGCFEQDGC